MISDLPSVQPTNTVLEKSSIIDRAHDSLYCDVAFPIEAERDQIESLCVTDRFQNEFAGGYDSAMRQQKMYGDGIVSLLDQGAPLCSGYLNLLQDTLIRARAFEKLDLLLEVPEEARGKKLSERITSVCSFSEDEIIAPKTLRRLVVLAHKLKTKFASVRAQLNVMLSQLDNRLESLMRHTSKVIEVQQGGMSFVRLKGKSTEYVEHLKARFYALLENLTHHDIACLNSRSGAGREIELLEEWLRHEITRLCPTDDPWAVILVQISMQLNSKQAKMQQFCPHFSLRLGDFARALWLMIGRRTDSIYVTSEKFQGLFEQTLASL